MNRPTWADFFRRRYLVFAIGIVALLAAQAGGVRFTWAQSPSEAASPVRVGAATKSPTAIQAALERTGPPSAERRAELHRQLIAQAEVLEKQSALLKTVAKLVGPTVVFVEAEVAPRAGIAMPGHRLEEAGSGVIVELRGKSYVLTSRHIVIGAQPAAIKINLPDGRRIYPEKVWEDQETDVAVMAVAAPDLIAAPVGDSDRVEVGDFVLAIGNPFGLSNSVTFGIISAKGRRDLDMGDSGVRLQDFLQTDASINPGNSGGPLVNLRGEVIGINTAIASKSGRNEGIGFAVPINMFMLVAKQLVEHGKASRAFLGVKLDTSYGPSLAVEIGLPRPIGARVVEVIKDSPASAANLQVGDVVLQYNGTPVEDEAHLVNLVNLTEIGKEVPLVVYRNRQTVELKVSVADRTNF
ncbi:MAG: S1C family serine protease [Thermoguttaceae bacterium]